MGTIYRRMRKYIITPAVPDRYSVFLCCFVSGYVLAAGLAVFVISLSAGIVGGIVGAIVLGLLTAFSILMARIGWKHISSLMNID